MAATSSAGPVDALMQALQQLSGAAAAPMASRATL